MQPQQSPQNFSNLYYDPIYRSQRQYYYVGPNGTPMLAPPPPPFPQYSIDQARETVPYSYYNNLNVAPQRNFAPRNDSSLSNLGANGNFESPQQVQPQVQPLKRSLTKEEERSSLVYKIIALELQKIILMVGICAMILIRKKFTLLLFTVFFFVITSCETITETFNDLAGISKQDMEEDYYSEVPELVLPPDFGKKVTASPTKRNLQNRQTSNKTTISEYCSNGKSTCNQLCSSKYFIPFTYAIAFFREI